MSTSHLRSYRVSLVACGAYAVWVAADSREAACELAQRLWRESRSALSWPHGGIERIDVLDEYEEDVAA